MQEVAQEVHGGYPPPLCPFTQSQENETSNRALGKFSAGLWTTCFCGQGCHFRATTTLGLIRFNRRCNCSGWNHIHIREHVNTRHLRWAIMSLRRDHVSALRMKDRRNRRDFRLRGSGLTMCRFCRRDNRLVRKASTPAGCGNHGLMANQDGCGQDSRGRRVGGIRYVRSR